MFFNYNNLHKNSGATNHMVKSRDILKNPSPIKGIDSEIVGNGDKLYITHIWDKNIRENLVMTQTRA